ncbi:CMRF35-like molecule 8 [Salmo salar]|uniref:CMRF35-like molecule 8 n=1 Tax=Salmo salar TaxID=8030 RepID=A0ABM3EBR3_SALSA|nr:CMRF35-like molecule 8 [Salmo salar]
MEKVFITTVILLLALCPAESEGLEVTGLVGGQVEIKCSHKFAKGNKKYFCKDTCTHSDILVQTEDSKKYIKTGRYSIDDRGDGDFTVTINNLKMSDSGTYKCGVDRFFIDTSQKVLLRVLDAPPIQPDITRTSPHPPVIVSRTTVVITTEKAVSGKSLTTATPTEAMTPDSAASVLVYIGTGLGMVVCVLVLVLLIFIRQRNRTKITESDNSKRTAFQPIYSTPTNQNIDTACDITTSTISCPDDIYSNIDPSAEVPDTVSYATVNFPRDPAYLHYATVNFPRDLACLHYETVNFTRDPA